MSTKLMDETRSRAEKLTTQKILVSVDGRIGLSQEDAFRFLTDASALSSWLPTGGTSRADDSKAQTPGGVGSVRVIAANPKIPPTLETVLAYEPSSFYAYSANARAFMGAYTEHLSAMGLEAHPDGGTNVAWVAYAKPGKSWLLRYVFLRVFRFVLWNGMRNLEKKFPVAR